MNIARPLANGSVGFVYPCVLCRKTLLLYDMTVHTPQFTVLVVQSPV